jgi:hypothetical protein
METIPFAYDPAGVVAVLPEVSHDTLYFLLPSATRSSGYSAVFRDIAVEVTLVSDGSTSDVAPVPLDFGAAVFTANGLSCCVEDMFIDKDPDLSIQPGTTHTLDLDMKALCQGLDGVFIRDDQDLGSVAISNLPYYLRGRGAQFRMLVRRVDLVSALPVGTSLESGSMVLCSTWVTQTYSDYVRIHSLRELGLVGDVFLHLDISPDIALPEDFSAQDTRIRAVWGSGRTADCCIRRTRATHSTFPMFKLFWSSTDSDEEELAPCRLEASSDVPQATEFRFGQGYVHSVFAPAKPSQDEDADWVSCFELRNLPKDIPVDVSIITYDTREVVVDA